MFSSIYFEQNREKNFIKKEVQKRILKIADLPLEKGLPASLEEIKLFNTKVTDKEYFTDNFIWLNSFQKEVQLEAELYTSSRFHVIYRDGIKHTWIVVGDKSYSPDFIYHGKFEGYNGVIVEMKTRNYRDKVESILNISELTSKLGKTNPSKNWGDFVDEEEIEIDLERIRTDFHLKGEAQIKAYEEYCKRNNYLFIILIVNSNHFDYGLYYNTCCILVNSRIEVAKKKLGKRDTSKILMKKTSYYTFMEKAKDEVSDFDLEFMNLCESLGLPEENTYEYYKVNKPEVNKTFMINFLENLPETCDWVNNSVLDTADQVKNGLNYHDIQERTVDPECGTNYNKQEETTGYRTRSDPLLILPVSEMIPIQKLEDLGLMEIRKTQRKLYDMVLFTQNNKKLFDEYEHLHATYGEFVSNSTNLSNNKINKALAEASENFDLILNKLKKKAFKEEIEVSNSGYIRPVDTFLKEKKYRNKALPHIDYMNEEFTTFENILKNISKYLKDIPFFKEEKIELENPLYGLLCSRLGEIYSKAGEKFLNGLYSDPTFKYLRVLMSIYDQYTADTKAILAREKAKTTKDGVTEIKEWCKVSFMNYLPIIVISSPPSNEDYNGIIVICTFHEMKSKIDDFLLGSTYIDHKDFTFRMQDIMRPHPQIVTSFNEYFCAYAGDYLFFSTYNYKTDDLLYHSCMYWTINRTMVKFATVMYLLYQKATLEFTLGKEDVRKEFEGIIVSDIRIALFLKRLRTFYPNFVNELQVRLKKKQINFMIKDPIFQIKIKDIQIHLGLINVKQIHPKRDGFIDAQVKSKFTLKDGLHMRHFENSNFYDLYNGFSYTMKESYERIFRKGAFKSKFELDPDGSNKLIDYFDSSTFNPQVMLWSMLNAADDNYGERKIGLKSNMPFNNSYWSYNTPSSVYVPDEFNPGIADMKSTENRTYFGFVSMKVPEASLELLQLVANSIDAQIHQVTIGDFMNKFDHKKFSIVFEQTKEQKGPDKRIFYITIVNKRISYIAFDNSFEDFLKHDKHDILEKPGEKKFQTFEMKMKKRFERSFITLFTLDATRFGDEMNCEGLKIMVYLMHKLGYYTKVEANWCISVLDSLSKRFLVLPKSFKKLMKKALLADKENYHRVYRDVLRWSGKSKDVREFLDEAGKEYPNLNLNDCMIKKVGFVLGVLNRCGTLTSIMIGHSFVTIQNTLFKGIDADWGTMSDDALGVACLYDKFNFKTKLTKELCKKILDYAKSGKTWSVDKNKKFIVNEDNTLMLTYSEWSLISWGILLLLYKAWVQNISTKKSGQGFTGEVLQVFLGYGKAILAIYKQLVNLGSTMQYFSAYEDLMSMMGSIYNLYVLGACMVMISNMFYLASSLIKTIYRVDLLKPFGFESPYWGPPELTLSFWMLPEAIRYTGFSGKERLLAMYETVKDNELISMYKKLSIVIIDNNEYVKSGKVDLETNETKAVSTNRVHLFILTLNKLKTKEVFFNVLKRQSNSLIKAIIDDIDTIDKYGANVREILENVHLLRQCGEIPMTKKELECYEKYDARSNSKINALIERGVNFKELASTIVKKLVQELKVFLIINYPKNYVRILLFLNKYLSRGFQLSYNKLSRASQIKSRLGFKTRKNLNFFTNRISKEVYKYEPENLNNTDICRILRDFSYDTSVEDLSSLSKNTYFMEIEFNRERMEFYTNLSIFGGTEQKISKYNFELKKEWTQADSVINSNIFYYSINDILTYVIEVLIKKVENPIIFELKPNYKNLDSFIGECNFIHKLLKNFGFSDSAIISNYNSISQTLETNRSPKTLRLMTERALMSQTRYNHTFGKQLIFEVSLTKDLEVSRFIPSYEENEDLIRYAFVQDPTLKINLVGEIINVETAVDIFASSFNYRNFHLWKHFLQFEFVKFTYEKDSYFGIIWGKSFVGLHKTKSAGVNSKYVLVTNVSDLHVSTLLDICFSITKFVDDIYRDNFISLNKNLDISNSKLSNVNLTNEGTYTLSASYTSNVQFHIIKKREIEITHRTIFRDYTFLLVPSESRAMFEENSYSDFDDEKGKKKIYLAYSTLTYNFKRDFDFYDKEGQKVRFSREPAYKISSFLKALKHPEKALEYYALASIINLASNPYYDTSEGLSPEEWATAAWLYCFDIKLNDVIDNITIFNEKSNLSDLQLYMNSVINTKIVNEENSKKFLIEFFQKKKIEYKYQGSSLELLKLDFLENPDTSSLKLALSCSIPFVKERIRNMDIKRFLKSDIYFSKKVDKYGVEKETRRINRNVSLESLFTEENLSENWVSKTEFYCSDQDLKQSLFIKNQVDHSLIKSCLNWGLIKNGCIHERVKEFIEFSLGLKLNADLNELDF